MLVIWLLHNGVTRQKAAEIVGVGRATVQRYVAAFREGGLDGLRQWNPNRPVSEMATYRELIRESFEKQPAHTIAEACERISSTDWATTRSEPGAQVSQRDGPEMAACSHHPRAPKKTLAEHVAIQADFLETQLNPVLDAASAGQGHVFFVDAAHFVFGTFLCCLWSFQRIFIRAASGRQRFNVLGAWNAVTRKLIAVTNTTVVNTETIANCCERSPRWVSPDRSRWYWTTPAINGTPWCRRWQLNRGYTPVLALVLAQPEPDRTPVEVPQTTLALRPLPSHVRGV